MASDLRELIHGGAEAKRHLFASENFAGDYGRSVIGRVKRRRAVTATAMGGGTVVAVGAIAVGGWQLTGAGFGFGMPGSAPAVVCTTTAAAPPSASADNAISLLSVPSPSGSVIWAVAIGSEDPPNIVANIALDLETHEVTGSIPDGNSLVLTPDTEGVYAVQFSDGNRLTFAVEAEELVLKSSSLEPTGAPTVTCVTTTPEPTGSSSPTSSPVPSPSLSPEPSTTAALVRSPFACGFEFPSEEDGDEMAIVEVETLTAEEAIAELSSQWGGDWDAIGVDRPTGDVLYVRAEPDARNPEVIRAAGFGGSVGWRDPVLELTGLSSSDGRVAAQAAAFVGVADRRVVATLAVSASIPGVPYLVSVIPDSSSGHSPATYLLDKQALVPCTDGATWDELYAVGGMVAEEMDDITGPYYAWKKVD